ncbi:MAG TPA: RNA polymerase sigma factor RpoD/SigA [Chitinophagaceae bacterium]|jgi:RNA polymerase sigma factor, sigma-70 family
MRELKIGKSITIRDSESLQKYFQEIKKIELLTPEEEVHLSVLIKNGDKAALDKLVKANLKFVVSVAKQYQNQGLSLPDLINEGNIGLMKAAQDFDHSRGFKFISYAIWWIRQNIMQAISMHARMIRLPMSQVALERQIKKTGLVMEQELGRQPSEDELADVMKMQRNEISFSLVSQHHISLDAPVAGNEEGCLLDSLENPDAPRADEHLFHTESLKADLQRSLQTLSQRQKETLCYFFGIGVEQSLSLDQISEKFNVSRERIRQIKDKAIAKLRTNKNSMILRSYMGVR